MRVPRMGGRGPWGTRALWCSLSEVEQEVKWLTMVSVNAKPMLTIHIYQFIDDAVRLMINVNNR